MARYAGAAQYGQNPKTQRSMETRAGAGYRDDRFISQSRSGQGRLSGIAVDSDCLPRDVRRSRLRRKRGTASNWRR